MGLALACDFEGGPAYSILEEIRTSARQRASQLRRAAGRLERDRKELGELLGSKTPANLEDGLKTAISQLHEEAKALRAGASRRYLNPAVALSLVVGYVEQKTGAPHYRDVSLLLESAYGTFGVEARGIIGEEAIRKALDRFKRRNPSLLDANGVIQVTQIATTWGFLAILLVIIERLISGRKAQPDANAAPNHTSSRPDVQ